MAALYGLRSKLGLTGIRERLGVVQQSPPPLEVAIAATRQGKTAVAGMATDPAVAARIAASYRAAVEDFPGYGESMWLSINDMSAPMHALLTQGAPEAIVTALDHPAQTNLFMGFDNPVAAPCSLTGDGRNLLSNEIGPDMIRRIFLALRRLAEAVGAIGIANPETGTGAILSPDDYLDLIDAKLGVALAFPNFYPDELGIETRRGIISYRPLQAIYQAWRLRTLGAGKVVEIGAGLGRTAFYAHLLGIRDYTIIDIPLSSVAQAHFLSRALGADQVSFFGEPRKPIRLVGPKFAEETDERFDVVLNVDSLSEMDYEVAAGYVGFALRSAEMFVSINREWDAPRAADLIEGKHTIRAPYWMRDGYVEEIVTL